MNRRCETTIFYWILVTHVTWIYSIVLYYVPEINWKFYEINMPRNFSYAWFKGYTKKWSPEKWSPEKWSPRKMVPGKMVPEKNGPRKNGPCEKWSPEKFPSKIVLRQKNARKFKRLFHFYQLIPLHTVSGHHFSRGPFFRGPFFSGTVFPRTIFSEDHFSGIRFKDKSVWARKVCPSDTTEIQPI